MIVINIGEPRREPRWPRGRTFERSTRAPVCEGPSKLLVKQRQRIASEPTATVVARLSLGVGLARPHFAGVSSAAIFLLAETTASRSTCSRVTFFVAYMYPTITAETTE